MKNAIKRNTTVNPLMKLVFIASILLCSITNANAALIYGIEGTDDGTAGIGAGQDIVGAVTSFSLSESFTNLDITIPIDCFSCTGTVFLSNQIGSGTDLTNIAVITTIESLTSQTIFENLSLDSGLYFVGMVVETGFGTWDTTTTPGVFSVAGTAAASPTQYTSTTFDAGFNPASLFIADLTASNAFLITVNADIAPVPLPGAFVLLLSGIAGFLPYLRKKRSDINS